jgi:hypothetical protein
MPPYNKHLLHGQLELLSVHVAHEIILLQVDPKEHVLASVPHLLGEIVAQCLWITWQASVDDASGEEGDVIAPLDFRNA